MRFIHLAFIALLAGFGLMALVTAIPSDAPSSADIAAGKRLHEEAAGGVGCASCHGMNAKGEGLAPDIRGADVARITDSLKNTGDMADLALSPAQVKQLAAYFGTLKPPA